MKVRPWHADRLVERFDRHEFAPNTRAGRGLCSTCDEPAAWMRFTTSHDIRHPWHGYEAKAVGFAFCEVHAAPYAKHEVPHTQLFSMQDVA